MPAPTSCCPAAAWGEKDGTVTNSERRISRQRPFLPAPGEAKPDWWMVTEVARRMGFADAFAYRSAADVFREHAALSAFENGGRRDFDIGGLADINDGAFDALDPVQWPLREGERRQEWKERRFFSSGGFYTGDGKARFVAPEMPAPKAPTSKEYPFRLNTGRVRDQWHTMTRSGLSVRLGAHLPEPFVEVHPTDAKAMELVDGGFAKRGDPLGRVRAQGRGQRRPAPRLAVRADSLERRHRLGRAHRRPGDAGDRSLFRPARLQGDAGIDRAGAVRLSGALRLRAGRSSLPQGNLVGARRRCKASGLLLATNDGPEIWHGAARQLFGDGAELAEYVDEQRGVFRTAAFAGGALTGCLFIGPAEAAPQWDAVKALFEAETLADEARRVLLSGRSADGLVSAGPIVCACFSVGLATIRDAIQAGTATSVEGIGKALRAGTNCGSCLPELKRIVADAGAERSLPRHCRRRRRARPAAARASRRLFRSLDQDRRFPGED